ncbi:MAG: hypothetical protein ACRDJV_03355 [Actinomycetota bacterium]
MKIAVEAWGPDYGGEIDLGPDDASAEAVDTSCEDRRWEPVSPPATSTAELPVAFVDGTRRMDARVFLMDGDTAPIPGVAGSVGVGVVLCEPRANGNGSWWGERRAECASLRIDRYLALGEGRRLSLSAGPGLEFHALPHPATDIDSLADAVHERMRHNEAELARSIASEDRLVFLDGPLAVMRPGAVRVVACIKSHNRRYLKPPEDAVMARLGCGQRSPLFAFGDPRPRYSWYVRLCELEDGHHTWHGLVRCECPAALGLNEAIDLADASALVLPAFASAQYWDPRAPQNLVPVAGLEKRLRHLLGDRELIARMIRSAARGFEGEEGE